MPEGRTRIQKFISRGFLLFALVGHFGATSATGAVPGPVDACVLAKLAATGGYVARLASAQRPALRSGTAVDPVALQRALSQFQKRFQRAEQRSCATRGDADRVAREAERVVDAALRDLGALPPPAAGSRCAPRKLMAAARLVRRVIRAHRFRLKNGDLGALQERVQKARDRYARAFAAAERSGDCPQLADAPVVRQGLDSSLDFLLGSMAVLRGEKVWLASSARPAQTPGTPGVVPTDPKLLTQFGGPGFDLNRAGYTRWRLRGPDVQPDAILVLVAGFGGGSNNFKILTENLVTRLAEDRGFNLEVWGFNRRTDLLEDRAGAFLADALGDPLVALDWYYGGSMGLPLSPALAGLGRRAVFYRSADLPFLANWTPRVFSQDLDAVVETARAVARNQNVFLGGHSAGTGFTARYAASDFNSTGVGAPEPGFAKLRGLVLLEGGGGSAQTPPLSSDSLDRIEARFDGGLFAAVRDGAPRCADGTPCQVASEAVDCAHLSPAKCTPSTAAFATIGGLTAEITAAAEPGSLQGRTDPNTGQAIVQVDVGGGGSAVATVPGLALLNLVPPATAGGLLGAFLDDDGLAALLSPAILTSMGGPGPLVNGLQTWLPITQPLPAGLTPDNGPPPATLPPVIWGREKEVVRLQRIADTFVSADTNAADWYFATSGLGTTRVPGVCDAGTGLCSAGDVGAACTGDADCDQGISLDSTALSVGRGRRDIENLTQAGSIDVPVICFGGSNGLTPVAASYLAFAQSLGPCTAASCDGSTPRVVDPVAPSEAFPTFGGVAGGYEVHIVEGFAHNDVVAAEDAADNPITSLLADFLVRNAP